MPSIIPEYQQRTSASSAGLGAGPSRIQTSGVGEGLQELGTGAESVVKAIDVVKERDAATWSTKTLSDTQSSWMQQLEDRKLKADPGAPNFTPDLLKDFDAHANEVAQGAPTRQSKAFMTERLLALREELQRNSMSFEAASRVQNNVNVANKSIDSAGNELINNPTLFPQRLAERNALFDAMPLTAEQKQQLKDKAQTELAKYAVMGRINIDPRKTLVDLQSPGTATPSQAHPPLPPANGLVDQGTIKNIWDRPILNNPDGSISTTLSFSIGTDKGETLIPSVIDGKKLTQQQAIDHYRKTGEHLGTFDTVEHADQYATALHNEQWAYIQNKTAAASKVQADPEIRALDPQARIELEQRARQTINAQYIDQEHQMALAKQAEELRQKQTQNGFLQKMTDGKLDAQTVLNSNLAPFGSGSKDEFLNMLRARDKQPKTDPTTFNELFARINLPDGATGKITDANQLNPYLIEQRLDIEDIGKLRNEIEGKGTAQGQAESKLKQGIFDVAKSTLTRSNPLIGLQDPIGDENLQRFTSWFLGEYQKQRGAGKSAAELLDPESPEYMGKRIRSYVRGPQDIMQDVLKSATQAPGQAVPRKEGESAEDYLKRTGKL